MNNNEMVYTYIEEIGKRLADPDLYGAASVMVGAGFSKNAKCLGDKKQLPPDWSQLAGYMFDELYPKERGNEIKRAAECSGKNVLALAQKYEVAFDRMNLNKMIEKSIADDMYAPSELHRKLMELNWEDVFTTNYDTLLERAMKQIESKKNYKIIYAQEDLLGNVRPRLIKLHGSIGHSGNYVITEEDYRTYPYMYAPLVNTVQQSMLETRLCLLGFSGDDPNFLNWLGWLRDNLGDKCPSIYLCGIFDGYSAVEKKMLERRKITLVDLACLVAADDENRYYNAIKKFFELINQEKNTINAKILKERPYTHLMGKENSADILKQYTDKMLLLSSEVIESLSMYMCIPKEQKNEISDYFERQLEWILFQDDFEQKIQLVDNYCGVLLKCNYPLFDCIADKLVSIVKRKQDRMGRLGNIILYLLQMYRVAGNTKQYGIISEKCETAIFQFPEKMRNELYIDFSKEYLTELDIAKAKDYIEKIREDRNDEYALKKACLLVQIGEKERAKTIMTNVVSFVVQQKYSSNRNASIIGYINLIARSMWNYNSNLELFSDEKYWLNEFNCRRILVEAKDDMISVLFESKEEQNCRKYSFNPNTYITTHTYGTTNQDKRVVSAYRYLLLQDLLCVWVYRDHRNTVDMAVEIIDYYSVSPLWKWYKMLTIGEEKYNDSYFTRMRIYEADIKYVEVFFDRLINLMTAYLDGSLRENKLQRAGKYEIFDILSRLSIVVDSQRIIIMLSLLVKYYKWEKDKRKRDKTVNIVMERVKYEIDTDILLTCLDNHWENEMAEYGFLSFFSETEVDSSKITRGRLTNIGTDILKGLQSGEEDVRNIAVIKYMIFKAVILQDDFESIRIALWEKTDENGFPCNKTYLPCVWLDEDESGVGLKMKSYLCMPQISRTVNGAVVYSDNSVLYEIHHYFVCLYRTIDYEGKSDLFTKEELIDLVKYFYEYIESEKTILDRRYADLGDVENRFMEINKIILLLCIYANRHKLLDERLVSEINKYIGQMEEIEMPCVGIQEFAEDMNYQKIYREFEDIILRGEDRLISIVFITVYGILLITSEDTYTRIKVEDELMKFIEKIPYLETEISKRVLLELHIIVKNVVAHQKKYVDILVNTLNRCYDIYSNDRKERGKQDLDGMYNVSDLTRTLYLEIKRKSMVIDTELLNLISKLKSNKLNEIRFKWEIC